MIPENLREKPCEFCGECSAGDLRRHAPGCLYVALIEAKVGKYATDFLAGKNQAPPRGKK